MPFDGSALSREDRPMAARRAKPTTSKRIPVPRVALDLDKSMAEFEHWCTFRDKPLKNATTAELQFALAMVAEWAPPATVEGRQAAFVRVCAWTLDRWERRLTRAHARKPGESAEAFEERVAPRRRELAEGLIESIRRLEAKAESVGVHDVDALLAKARRNESPARLALEISRLAQVWPRATFESLRKNERADR